MTFLTSGPLDQLANTLPQSNSQRVAVGPGGAFGGTEVS